jgi:hypothetical protein
MLITTSPAHPRLHGLVCLFGLDLLPEDDARRGADRHVTQRRRLPRSRVSTVGVPSQQSDDATVLVGERHRGGGGTVASTGVARAGDTIASAAVVTTDGAPPTKMGVSSVATIVATTGTASSASAGRIMMTTGLRVVEAPGRRDWQQLLVASLPGVPRLVNP